MSDAKKAEKVEKFEMISAEIGGDEATAKKRQESKESRQSQDCKS